MSELKKQRDIAQKFQKTPLPSGPLTEGSFPYVGPHAIQCLQKALVTSGDQLAAVFLFMNRDAKKFAQWLCVLGITGFWAERIAAELVKKFKKF